MADTNQRTADGQSWATRRRPHENTGVVDVAMLQSLAREDDIKSLTSGYGLVVADECHHVPAAGFEHAVKQIPARRWLGLTATPYRRDQLDDLIAFQFGPIRHTIACSHRAPLRPTASHRSWNSPSRTGCATNARTARLRHRIPLHR